MKLKLKKQKHDDKLEENADQGLPEEALTGYLDVKRKRAPEGYSEVETYPLKPPFSYAYITRNEDTADFLYIVDELLLSREER